ncbi:MAG: helix-turn-helix domain-containing protein [Dissulfurispiraceae bacterium]
MLEQIRKLFGYTQRELAGQVGIDQRYYTQIETKKSKSAKVIKSLSDKLQIKESYLTFGGDEYPFMSDFYVFSLSDSFILSHLFAIETLIIRRSAVVDVVFFIAVGQEYGQPYNKTGHQVVYIALKDDQNTVFLLKRPKSTMHTRMVRIPLSENKEITIHTFPAIIPFLVRLHSLPDTIVNDRAKIVSWELCEKIEVNRVVRDDILEFFPDNSFFRRQLKLHLGIKSG